MRNQKKIIITSIVIIVTTVSIYKIYNSSTIVKESNPPMHPKKERFEESDAVTPTNDYRKIKIKPNVSFQFKGKKFSSNSIGLRDTEIQKKKKSNEVRFLVLGSSFVMGSGVADNEVFDKIIESSYTSNDIQILNAGCSTYDLIESIVQFEKEKLFEYDISYMLIVSHGVDKQKNIVDLAYALRNNINIPFTYLQYIMDTANLDSNKNNLNTQLSEVANDIIIESYKYLYKLSKINNIHPVWVYWPTTGMRPGVYNEYKEIKEIVEQIGYHVIDLSDLYNGIDKETVHVAPNDRHPNAKGHKIFAEALYPKLIELINKVDE